MSTDFAADLRDAASRFAEDQPKAPKQASEPSPVEADPTAAGTSPTPPVEADPTAAAAPRQAMSAASWQDRGLPVPSRRRGTGRRQFAAQVPARQFELVAAAAESGMSASLLVLSAMDAHGDRLREAAGRSGLVLPSEPGRSVTLRLSGGELADLDALAEAVAPALGRRSRSATVVLLLDFCLHAP